MVLPVPSPAPAPPAPPAVPRRRGRRGLVAALIAIPLVLLAVGVAVWFAFNSTRPTPPAAGSTEFAQPLRMPELAQ
jgi:hypothetical protein